MKSIITLDPEYIPWEPGNPVVRLRRKKNKALLAILGIGFFVMVFGGGLFFAQQNSALGTPAPDLVAAPVPTARPTPVAQPTPALLAQGQPGKLAVIRGLVVSFFPCATYSVRAGETVIGAGDTASGPIIDVTNYGEVTIECEHEAFIY
jgi:hypothetical protein